jgi:hypothetical protein
MVYAPMITGKKPDGTVCFMNLLAVTTVVKEFDKMKSKGNHE